MSTMEYPPTCYLCGDNLGRDDVEAVLGGHVRCIASEKTSTAGVLDAMVTLFENSDPVLESDRPIVGSTTKLMRDIIARHAGSVSVEEMVSQLILEAASNMDGVFSKEVAEAASRLGRAVEQKRGDAKKFFLKPSTRSEERYSWRESAKSGVMKVMRQTS